MPLTARCLLIALDFLLLSSPSIIEQRFGAGSHPYAIATLLLVVVNAPLIWWWERSTRGVEEPVASPRLRLIAALLVGVAAAFVLLAASQAWLREILIHPHDSQRADMLVVIQAGIKRLLRGENPYTIYQVPWPAPLPYGPVMWAPFIVPHLLHADVRFVTILGALFVPTCAAVAAVAAAERGRLAPAAAFAILLAAIALNADLHRFIAIGHTPAYWPVLAAFAWVVARQRWLAAAMLCGLLIVGRSTMVSVAPVLLMAVWLRARARFIGALVVLAAAALLPYLPFAIADLSALKYALFDSYQSVMKGFVWTSTTWVQHTIGATGLLLSRGWKGAVELVQVAAMLAVYAAAWRAIRRGRAPLPWMGLALLAFSMTTLWPVIYVYFDVFLLLACAALAESTWIRGSRLLPAWTATLATGLALLVVTAWRVTPLNPSIDVGTGAARPYLYAGFVARDDRQPDRTFTWVVGDRAEVLIPRRSTSEATIDIVCEPPVASGAAGPHMSVLLNGSVLDTILLTEGWQQISVRAPGRVWQIGVNELVLFVSGDNSRRLSLALDRLIVRTN